MELIQYLFLPIQPFIFHPGRIMIVSGVFFLGFMGVYLFNRKHLLFQHWLLLACAVIWALFAAWETYCKTMEYNIRVDLLLIYPVLVSITLFSVITNIVRPLLHFHGSQRNGENKNA